MQKDFSLNSNNEDSVLFHLIKKRDKNAFTQVYEKYHKYLYTLAYRFLKNSEMAEDAVQHVFVKLWISTREINIEVNLKNYLYTMTKNYILNQIRDNKEIISINYEYAQMEVQDDSTDILKMLEDKQLTDFLYKSINDLPPQKREICIKKIEENKSNQEIAEEMGLSVNTVKSHYQESIKILRNYFNKFTMIIFMIFVFLD
ncbi:RNA polymerase sigma-70 factor, expansion family 1 [uncultured Paludibacter sp.]|nr:RNA polymerase sigma-70 factor, expansion family 1 [uncultured Paludibacter sp.]